MKDGYYWYKYKNEDKWCPIRIIRGMVLYLGTQYQGNPNNLDGELIPLPTPDETQTPQININCESVTQNIENF